MLITGPWANFHITWWLNRPYCCMQIVVYCYPQLPSLYLPGTHPLPQDFIFSLLIDLTHHTDYRRLISALRLLNHGVIRSFTWLNPTPFSLLLLLSPSWTSNAIERHLPSLAQIHRICGRIYMHLPMVYGTLFQFPCRVINPLPLSP